MYGKIGESRLLNIEVYKDKTLLYKGKIEEAPDEVKNLNYSEVRIIDGIVIYDI